MARNLLIAGLLAAASCCSFFLPNVNAHIAFGNIDERHIADHLSSNYNTNNNEQDPSGGRSATSSIRFPPQFYVTTGTTIPFIGSDPVAQTGAIYYDELNQRVRVDNFWLGNQRSFVVDLASERGYVLSNGQCTTLKLTGDLKRYGVPDGAIRSMDPVAVRGVPVLHYTAVEKEETIQLVDFYVRPMNLTFAYDHHASGLSPDEYDTTAANEKSCVEGSADCEANDKAGAASTERRVGEDEGAFFVPWQIRSKRLRQRSIAPNPETATRLPNWRFFGEPMDEVITAEEAEDEFADPRHTHTSDGKYIPRGAVEKLVEDVTVTVDFFNFIPAQPSPTIFEVPTVCVGQEPKHEYSYDVNVHQAQRMLVDMSFNSRPGRKLMDHMWAAEQVKRVGAGSSGSKRLPPTNTKKSPANDGEL